MIDYEPGRLWQIYGEYQVLYLDEDGYVAETLSADAPPEAWEAFHRAKEIMRAPDFVPMR